MGEFVINKSPQLYGQDKRHCIQEFRVNENKVERKEVGSIL